MRCRRDRAADLFNPLEGIERDLYGELFRNVADASSQERVAAFEWALSQGRRYDDEASAAEICAWVFGERDFSDRQRLEREYVIPRDEWSGAAARLERGRRRLIEIEALGRTDPFPHVAMTATFVDARVSDNPMWADNETVALSIDRESRDGPLSLVVLSGQEISRRPLTLEQGMLTDLACGVNGRIGWREQRIVPGRVEANALASLTLSSGETRRRNVTSPYVLSVTKPYIWTDGNADWINPYTCEIVDHTAFMQRLDTILPADRYDRTIFPLRPGDGYVVAVRDETLVSHNRLALVSADLTSSVDLGLQPEWRQLVWSARDAAYIIPVEVRGSFYADNPISIPVVDPEQRSLRTIEIARTALNEADVEYWPSAAGLLGVVKWYETPRGHLPGGLYLISEHGPLRLYQAREAGAALRMRSISPDGCSVVLQEFATRTIMESAIVIDLCTASNRAAIASVTEQLR